MAPTTTLLHLPTTTTTSSSLVRLHTTSGARLPGYRRTRYSRDARSERSSVVGRPAYLHLDRTAPSSANPSIRYAARAGDLAPAARYLAGLRRTTPGQRRYTLTNNAGTVYPWADSVRARLQHLFGDDDVGRGAVDLIVASISGNTANNYQRNVRLFTEFCADFDNISPLEATEDTVVRYTSWLAERGTIKAKSLQQYYSAINKFFELHGLAPIAKDNPHLTAARKGLAIKQFDTKPRDIRVALPADIAYDFVQRAERMVTDAAAPFTTADTNLFRALTACVVNFLFFNRGITGVSSRVQDLLVDDHVIVLNVYREKNRIAKQGLDYRVITIPVSEHPRIAALLRFFVTRVQSRPVPGSTSKPIETNFWATTSSEQQAAWTADTMTDWLKLSLAAVSATVPSGYSWTSHSLRSGPASAANAINVTVTHIRHFGGWARNSDVVHDYIDPNVVATPGAWFFFGFISPHRSFLRLTAVAASAEPELQQLPVTQDLLRQESAVPAPSPSNLPLPPLAYDWQNQTLP